MRIRQIVVRALPPGRCDTDVGIHQPHQCPLGAPECTTLCPPVDFPVGDHTRSIFLDEEMHHLRRTANGRIALSPAARSAF